MKKFLKRVPFDVKVARDITKGYEYGQVVTEDGRQVRVCDLYRKGTDHPLTVYIPKKSALSLEYIDTCTLNGKTFENGQLYMEVFDTEKPKDGIIAKLSCKECTWVSLIKNVQMRGFKVFEDFYASVNIDGWHKGELTYNGSTNTATKISIATEEEKEKLIEALKKDGSKIAKKLLKKYFNIEIKEKKI